MTRLELRNVGVDVAGEPLLRGVTLDVPAHELHVLLGPSGSGKTTLLKAIAGLHPLAQGEILLDGQRIDDVRAEQRAIVLLHQDDTLFPHLAVAGNVGFGLRIRGRSNDEIAKRTSDLLRLVGLEGFQGRRVTQLSGGERQRVALARALAVEPRILLLDEPFSALDRLLRQSLRDDVRKILREAGVTALFVTHDRDEALGLADRLVLIREGQVADTGGPARVFQRPATLAGARVLGRRNLFRYRRDGGRLQTDAGPIPASSTPPAEGWVLVNEEDIDLRATPTGSGRVEAIEFLGTRTLYRVRRLGEAIHAERPGPPGFALGEQVELVWTPERHVVYDAEGKTPQS